MIARAPLANAPWPWLSSGLIALVVHAGAIAVIVTATRLATPTVPEPVVLVELPPLPAQATRDSTMAAPVEPTPLPQPTQAAALRMVRPQHTPSPLANPRPMATPVPAQPAQPDNDAPVRPVAPAAAAAVAAASAPPAATPAASAPVAADAATRRTEANYFASLSAHLNRRKTYPAEARQARQQGTVAVRFTVDRAGNVSNVSIRRSSGHAILDSATLALVERVAPMPRMPASMRRDSITITLPIEYSLDTD